MSCAAISSSLWGCQRVTRVSSGLPAQFFASRSSPALGLRSIPSSSSRRDASKTLRFAVRASADDGQLEAEPSHTPLESLSTHVKSIGSAVLETLKSSVKPAVLVTLILAASFTVLTPDMAALAAKGGGRVGGSSFSSSRSRSYSAPSSSYSAPRIGAPSYSAPYYAPSPFFGGGYGWSPFSFFAPTVVVGVPSPGFGIFNLLFLLLIAFFIYNAVTGFLSQGEDGEFWTDEVSDRTSVIRLQVGLLGIARGLQQDLDRMAARADTSSPEGLHYILSETVLSLLRNPDYCVSGFSSSQNLPDSYAGERSFNSLSMEERSKFKEETLVNVDGNVRRRAAPRDDAGFSSEFIVITILAAVEGKLELPAIRSSSDLRSALSALGSIPAEQLQAVEILWTPQNEGDTLSEREMVQDYPMLRSL